MQVLTEIGNEDPLLRTQQCCSDCFSYEWLRSYVQENSQKEGDCDYCGRKGTKVIPVHDLCHLFENLLNLYTPSNDPYGERLVDLIQWDYNVFSEDLYDSEDAASLLEDILGSGWDDDSGEPPVDAHELYYSRSSLWYHTSMAQEWEEFCEKVRENPAIEPNLPALFEEELARMEVKLAQEAVIFRARVGFIDDGQSAPKPFENEDIGAPPPDKARAARANVEGEIVFYAADQERTAIAEVRPWRGIVVSVAEASASETLTLVDLSKPPFPSNPFTDEAPQYESELEDLLLAFGTELGRPLRRADDPRDYLPCQKLVRRIRECGFYHGIRYPSAMVPGGTNIVIFDRKLVRIGPSKIVQISDLEISYGPFDDE